MGSEQVASLGVLGRLVCTDPAGRPLHPDGLSRTFKRLALQVGLDPKVRLHDVRHAVATFLLEEGESALSVAAQLGHADAGFTQNRYGHRTEKMRQSAGARLAAASAGGE